MTDESIFQNVLKNETHRAMLDPDSNGSIWSIYEKREGAFVFVGRVSASWGTTLTEMVRMTDPWEDSGYG